MQSAQDFEANSPSGAALPGKPKRTRGKQNEVATCNAVPDVRTPAAGYSSRTFFPIYGTNWLRHFRANWSASVADLRAAPLPRPWLHMDTWILGLERR